MIKTEVDSSKEVLRGSLCLIPCLSFSVSSSLTADPLIIILLLIHIEENTLLLLFQKCHVLLTTFPSY